MWLCIHNARKVPQSASFKEKPCWITEGKKLTSDDSAYTHSVWPISICNDIMNKDSVRKYSDFFCHIWINFQAKNWILRESVGLGRSSQAHFQMSYFNVRNCFPFYLLCSPLFFFFLIRTFCANTLLELLTNQVKFSSTWLVHRPLC